MNATAKKIFTTTVLTLIALVAVMSCYGEAYAGSYSPDRAAAYAQRWANSYNDAKYKRIDNDCTNFVSQCIAEGGKSFVSPAALNISSRDFMKGYAFTTDNRRWYNAKYAYTYCGYRKNVFCYSSSFTFVNDFYQFWSKQRCTSTFGIYTSCSKNSSLQKQLRKGDILQLYDKGSGWHHTMIITSGRTGDWNYCAHTYAAKDRPLKNINAQGRKFRVIRINY